MNTDQLRGLERLTATNNCGEQYIKVPTSQNGPSFYWESEMFAGDKRIYGQLARRLALYESLVPALLAERDALKERCEVAEVSD